MSEHLTMEFRSGAMGHLIYDDATWPADLPSEGLFSWGPTWDEMAKGEGLALTAAWHSHPGSIRVFGTTGTLRIFHYANRLFLRNAKGVQEIPVHGRPMPGQFAAELASFVETIRSGGEPVVSGEDGRRALAAVLGVYDGPALARVPFDSKG